MQPQLQLAGEGRGLRHQPLGDREGRAGRDRDLRPRPGPGLVEREEALRVRKDGIHVLDEVVGREPALGLADVHRPARGDEAHAELPRRLDLGLDEAGAPRREDVVVVEDRRAPAERQLGKPGAGGRILRLGVDAAPERVERLQPREEVGLLRPGTCQRLVQVVVRVDEPRRDERAPEVLEVLREGRGALAHLDDEAVLRQDPGAVDLGARIVHGDDVGVRKQRPHGA